MKFKVIKPFSIVRNAGTLTNFVAGNTVAFNIGDTVSYDVQSGSLGDLYSFVNHTTNEIASKMILEYQDPFKNKLEAIIELP